MPVCPQCHTHYEATNFSCPSCEVILEDTSVFNVPAPEKPETDTPTLVEALLSPRPSVPAPPLPPGGALPFESRAEPTPPVPEDVDEVPDNAILRILDVDLQGHVFTPEQARFLAFVDRRWPAKDVREAAGLSVRKFALIVQRLAATGVIEVQEKTEDGIILPRRTPPPPPEAAREVPAIPEPPAPAVAAPPPTVQQPPPPPAQAAHATRLPPGAVRRVPIEEKPRSNEGTRLRVGDREIVLPPRRDPNAPLPRAVAPTPLEQAVELEKAGNWQDALAVLESAIRRGRKPAPLYNRLAIVVARYRRDFKEAERLGRLAVEMEPENWVYQQNLLKILALAAANTGRSRVQ